MCLVYGWGLINIYWMREINGWIGGREREKLKVGSIFRRLLFGRGVSIGNNKDLLRKLKGFIVMNLYKEE